MCLKSGWLDFLKFSIDRVLKNHDFDGVYYDWNLALYCNNPLHVGKESNSVPIRELGSLVLSPTGHWDIDELIELVEWTRERVGPEGLALIHNTLVPMFATENFANYVVGMEFGYNRMSESFPKLNELPLEWNFVGARSRAAISGGLIDRRAPRRLHQHMALTGLLTSVAPWRATPEAIALFKLLQPLGDLEQYSFADWRNEAVRLDCEDCASAVYSRSSDAYVILGNFNPEPRKVTCVLFPEKLPIPLPSVSCGEILNGDRIVSLDPSLVDYGFRPAVSEEMGNIPHAWQNGQIWRWGKVRPGTHFDLPFRTRYVPRYLVLANHGVEGIEWFMSDDLSQWDYQVSGQPGTGYCEMSPRTNPLGIAVSVCPLNLSSSFNLPCGGFVELKDSFVFDYYIGVPVLEGHASNPWLNKAYRANKWNWISEEEIKKNAEDGLCYLSHYFSL